MIPNVLRYEKENNGEKIALIYQSVENENIDYFYQLKENQDLTFTNLNNAFNDCARRNASLDFTSKLVELGAHNFPEVLRTALYEKKHEFAQKLFTIKKHINVFDNSIRDDRFYYEDYFPKVIELSRASETFPLFKRIVYSMPNHTQRISKAKVYVRGHNSRDFHDYGYFFNRLLNHLLILTIEDFRSGKNIDTMLDGFKILAQRSFTITVENIELLNEIIYPEFKNLFSKRLKMEKARINLHIKRQNESIKDIDDKFYCTDMAQRQLLNLKFSEFGGDEKQRQKFRVYLEIARHLKIPHSLNQTMWQAMFCRMNKTYEKRLPDAEEYLVLKQLDNSGINHQKLVEVINRYVYYDKAKLYEKLDNALNYQDSEEIITKV
jgi:hypothetical protein